MISQHHGKTAGSQREVACQSDSKMAYGKSKWKDGSVGKVLALQAGRPEFKPWCGGTHFRQEDSWGLLVRQLKLCSKLQIFDSLSQKLRWIEMDITWRTTSVVDFWPPNAHTYTHTLELFGWALLCIVSDVWAATIFTSWYLSIVTKAMLWGWVYSCLYLKAYIGLSPEFRTSVWISVSVCPFRTPWHLTWAKHSGRHMLYGIELQGRGSWNV